jgi:hypothetical protein
MPDALCYTYNEENNTDVPMINDRPKHLMNQAAYGRIPAEPFAVRFDALPELVRKSLGPVGGIQPVTGAMIKAANNQLTDIPCEAEVKLFREAGTVFQMVSVVLSLAHMSRQDGVLHGIPYALTLVPGSKRDALDERNIDFVSKLDIQNLLNDMKPSYVGFDPFAGSWTLYGPLSLFIGEKRYNGFLDELGVVVAQYFLNTDYAAQDVLEVPLGLPTPKAEQKYGKHRAKLLYKPFAKVEPRRLWGAQSAIELFLFQELLLRGKSPSLQMLLFENGGIYPSLYDLWKDDVEFRDATGLISECDLFFPDEKVAVFCDSTRHHRGGKAQEKDAEIDEKLKAIGVTSVRVQGKQIVDDLKAAADKVCASVNPA